MDSGVSTYCSLNARKPSSENGRGERSSQAQNAVSGLPRAARMAAARSKPSFKGSGSRNTARSIWNPGSAATPPEYWNTAEMKR